MQVLFYVSGHGFGHARRMVQVIRALGALRPDLSLHVRSATPPHIFEPLPAVRVQHSDIDCGLVEIDPLTIDREASLQRLMAFTDRRAAIVDREVQAVRELTPSLIVADIPFLAGSVARAADVPCVGISNFSWDWIYENLFCDDRQYAQIAPIVAEGYAAMSRLLHLPFGQVSSSFREIVPTPLIALRGQREPGEVLEQIGVDPCDRRPRVLFGTRGGVAPHILQAAANEAREFLFLIPGERGTELPENARAFALGPKLDFSDVLKTSDVVVSKLGYGMISECIASQSRLVWPPRQGFAEDAVVAAEAPRYLRMLPMPREEFLEGRWGEYLRDVMILPSPMDAMRTDGAEVCAQYLSNMVGCEGD